MGRVENLESVSLPYPYWLKADYGTAGRSVYKITSKEDLAESCEQINSE